MLNFFLVEALHVDKVAESVDETELMRDMVASIPRTWVVCTPGRRRCASFSLNSLLVFRIVAIDERRIALGLARATHLQSREVDVVE